MFIYNKEPESTETIIPDEWINECPSAVEAESPHFLFIPTAHRSAAVIGVTLLPRNPEIPPPQSPRAHTNRVRNLDGPKDRPGKGITPAISSPRVARRTQQPSTASTAHHHHV